MRFGIRAKFAQLTRLPRPPAAGMGGGTAILDRLLHLRQVITIRGDSYRLCEERSGLLHGNPALAAVGRAGQAGAAALGAWQEAAAAADGRHAAAPR
jgi:hypothetical protein